MNTRRAFVLGLATLLGSAACAMAQPTPPPPVFPGDAKTTPLPSPMKKEAVKDTARDVYLAGGDHSGLSDWITYRQRGCGSSGWDPAIQTEIYLRVGPSFPIGGELFGDILSAGWMIQGGGKALFFNDPHTRAWFVDVSIANTYNHANDQAQFKPVVVAQQLVAIREYNRTFVGLGIGREWFLRGTALDDGPTWRFGIDTGGRYGSASVDFNDLQHRSDVIGGIYVGAQTDIQWPASCAPCVFVFGLRGEYGYTWSDVLERKSDLQDLNLLVHFGVRY